MSLLEQIGADRLHHRKQSRTNADSKAAATALTTLVGEAAIVGKNDGGRATTDDEVVKVVKKFIKGIRDNQKYRPITSAELKELELYEAYIPATIDADTIHKFAVEFLSNVEADKISMKLMGGIMKALNEAFPKQIDGQLAGPIIKQLITGK